MELPQVLLSSLHGLCSGVESQKFLGVMSDCLLLHPPDTYSFMQMMAKIDDLSGRYQSMRILLFFCSFQLRRQNRSQVLLAGSSLDKSPSMYGQTLSKILAMSSTGLRLASGGAQMTRTWIVYNKPKEPSYTHAGMLMGLGLTGRLFLDASC